MKKPFSTIEQDRFIRALGSARNTANLYISQNLLVVQFMCADWEEEGIIDGPSMNIRPSDHIRYILEFYNGTCDDDGFRTLEQSHVRTFQEALVYMKSKFNEEGNEE